jgi:hypothetical protein
VACCDSFCHNFLGCRNSGGRLCGLDGLWVSNRSPDWLFAGDFGFFAVAICCGYSGVVREAWGSLAKVAELVDRSMGGVLGLGFNFECFWL